MDDPCHSDICDYQLAFFGSICASLSHEINNVMAIIGELNGLLEDMTASPNDDPSFDASRMRNAIERVSHQIQRGAEYVKQLNGFSHSIDNSDVDLDSSSMLDFSILLCNRFAKLRKVVLNVIHKSESPKLRGSAFNLQHLFIRCIKLALVCSRQDSSIDIELSSRSGLANIVLSNREMDARQMEGSDDLVCLRQLLSCLGGALRMETSDSGAAFLAVDFPRNVNPPRPNQKQAGSDSTR
jgi:hypothetical protein